MHRSTLAADLALSQVNGPITPFVTLRVNYSYNLRRYSRVRNKHTVWNNGTGGMSWLKQ